MEIGQDEIMRIARKQQDRRPHGDDVVFWLIVGGWAAVVAILDFLSGFAK